MTHGRMHTMTQGRDGISLAPTASRRLVEGACRLSFVAATLVIAALVAGSAGTSYAKSKKQAKHHNGPGLLDTVVVSNYGVAFGGSLETFLAGAGRNAKPDLYVHGTNTLLGSGTGPEFDAVSSLDAHVALATPIDLLDLAGFGAPAGVPGVVAAGTGFAEIFGPGSDKNSPPENVIGTRNVAFGFPNTSGVNTPQGVAFEDPFDGINPGHDIVAITNTLPTNFFSTEDFLDGTNGGAGCNAFGSGTCTGPGTPMACCTGAGTGTCAGMVVGTITEFDRDTLAPGFNDGVAPINNTPECTVPAVDIPPGTEPPTSCPDADLYNATIGGCLTFLLGPVADAYDSTGFLFVVNEAAVAQGGPGFVTVYEPGASGDSFPFAVVGLTGTTAGAFVDPSGIAVASDSDFFDDIIFVNDVGDNSIKIFEPFVNGCESPPDFFCTGEQIGEISGGSTKLKRPEGIALGVESGALYVVNNDTSTLTMYTDFTESGGDIAPTLTITGRQSSKLNFPVGVALPEFTPSASPSDSGGE